MWKNLKHIVDIVEKDCVTTKAAEAEAGGDKEADGDADEDDQSNSEYILLKDFNKLVLRLFKKDLQEEEEDEEEGAEEEGNWVYIINESINYTHLTKINFLT